MNIPLEEAKRPKTQNKPQKRRCDVSVTELTKDRHDFFALEIGEIGYYSFFSWIIGVKLYP